MNTSRKIMVQGKSQISVFRFWQNKILSEQIAVLPNIQTVLNVGSMQGDVDKEGKLYRDYFPQAKYFTLDKNLHEDHPQHFNRDIHDLSGMDQTFDLILLMSVLEHVERPWKALSQLQGLMHDNSYVFLAVPFFYPIHKDWKARYSDYWRFTDDALRVLCDEFDEVWIKPFDSVILSVEDRDCYWNSDKTPSGYAGLFKKKKVLSSTFATEIDPQTGVLQRKYDSYQSYLDHQGEKLDKNYGQIFQSDQEYEKILLTRFEGLNLSLVGKNVLCLGARLGGEVRAFKALGALALGTDINPGKKNEDVMFGDVHHIKFPDQVFDIAYCNILDHILNIPLFVQEVTRVLKVNGILLLECAQVGLNPNKYEVVDTNNLDVLLKVFSRYFDVVEIIDIQNKTQFIDWSGKLITFKKHNA